MCQLPCGARGTRVPSLNPHNNPEDSCISPIFQTRVRRPREGDPVLAITRQVAIPSQAKTQTRPASLSHQVTPERKPSTRSAQTAAGGPGPILAPPLICWVSWATYIPPLDWSFRVLLLTLGLKREFLPSLPPHSSPVWFQRHWMNHDFPLFSLLIIHIPNLNLSPVRAGPICLTSLSPCSV